MRAERRDPTLLPKRSANPRGEEPVSEAKPYDISKQLVWEAYQRVKANRGAAGVDGVSLAAFEKDLKGNLYKVWNRMSSGSYHGLVSSAARAARRDTEGQRWHAPSRHSDTMVIMHLGQFAFGMMAEDVPTG
jgi:hypothetical protein